MRAATSHQAANAFITTMICYIVALFPSAGSADTLELESYFGPGEYCSEQPIQDFALQAGQDCGQRFYQINGRLSFPLLVNHGPIRIEVRTIAPDTRTRFPLFVGYLPRTLTGDLGCTTVLAARFLFTSDGVPAQCGGIWESIGPFDLSQVGVPVGERYHVQLEGLDDIGGGSTAIAGIRVTTVTDVLGIRPVEWGAFKQIYRE